MYSDLMFYISPIQTPEQYRAFLQFWGSAFGQHPEFMNTPESDIVADILSAWEDVHGAGGWMD